MAGELHPAALLGGRVALLDLVVLRIRLLRRKAFWAAYAIMCSSSWSPTGC